LEPADQIRFVVVKLKRKANNLISSGIIYSMRDTIHNSIVVRQPRSCDMAHISVNISALFPVLVNSP